MILKFEYLPVPEIEKESSSFSPMDAKRKLNFLFFELG